MPQQTSMDDFANPVASGTRVCIQPDEPHFLVKTKVKMLVATGADSAFEAAGGANTSATFEAETESPVIGTSPGTSKTRVFGGLGNMKDKASAKAKLAAGAATSVAAAAKSEASKVKDLKKFIDLDLEVFHSTEEADRKEMEAELRNRRKWGGVLHPETTISIFYNQMHVRPDRHFPLPQPPPHTDLISRRGPGRVLAVHGLQATSSHGVHVRPSAWIDRIFGRCLHRPIYLPRHLPKLPQGECCIRLIEEERSSLQVPP